MLNMHDTFWAPGGEDVLGLRRGNMIVVWSNIGEGVSGDYNPDDPDDRNLLRFYFFLANPKASDADIEAMNESAISAIDDASYCTRMPASASEDILKRGLIYLMDEAYDPTAIGATDLTLARVPNLKKLCERLSWISPETLEKTI